MRWLHNCLYGFYTAFIKIPKYGRVLTMIVDKNIQITERFYDKHFITEVLYLFGPPFFKKFDQSGYVF